MKKNLGTLFIQSTTRCIHTCRGCYVKAWEEKQVNLKHHDHTWWNKTFQLLQEKFIWNQTTYALDNLSEPDYVFLEYLKLNTPNKHITVNSVSDLRKTIALLDNPIDLIKTLSLISVSNINTLSDIEYLRQFNTKINYNLTLSQYTNINKIKTLLPYLDSIHLVLFKEPLGGNNYDLPTYLNKAKELLSTEYKNKIYLDGCVTDSKKFLDTGWGCAANVSKFQIMPSGAVQGCPYASLSDTPPAHNPEDVIKNIFAAEKTYSFSSCNIYKQFANLVPLNRAI